MAYRIVSPNQPKDFTFSEENLKLVDEIIARYPQARAAIMPLFHLAQQQERWLSKTAIEHIAKMLGVPFLKAWEVATFYTEYLLAPPGRNFIQICRTTPCWLCGSEKLAKVCKEVLNIDYGQTTADGVFTLGEIECLGACSAGPVVRVNDDFYEKVDVEKMHSLLQELKDKPRPQIESQD